MVISSQKEHVCCVDGIVRHQSCQFPNILSQVWQQYLQINIDSLVVNWFLKVVLEMVISLQKEHRMEVLKVTINICSKHFACWGHEMQCASTAIQLFSATYAAAFRLAGELERADIIITINNWFDCMNSKSSGLEQANKFRSPLGTQWEHQEQAMLDMLKLMESMVRHALYFTLFKAILY